MLKHIWLSCIFEVDAMVFAIFHIGMVFANLLCSNLDAIVQCEASRQHTVTFVNHWQFHIKALHSTDCILPCLVVLNDTRSYTCLLSVLSCHQSGLLLLAVPYYPGGSLYARNPPVQKEVSLLLYQASCGFVATNGNRN